MKTLALVSGGPDSVYLFHFLRERGEDFEVVHFNHHLRGAESDAEQAFVEQLCRDHGVICHVRHLTVPAIGNMQATARDLRLNACFELQIKYGYVRAVLAHHRDDQLETLLMRLKRGAGLSGLCGIRHRRTIPNPLVDGLSLALIRPLLDLSKTAIVDSLKTRGLAYCLDSSNSKDRYFRNRVRAALSSKPAPHEDIFWCARSLQGIDAYFSARVGSLAKAYPLRVPPEVWVGLPEELQFRLFSRLMRKAGYQKQIERKHFALIQNRRHVKLVLDRAEFRKNRAGCNFSSLPTTAV